MPSTSPRDGPSSTPWSPDTGSVVEKTASPLACIKFDLISSLTKYIKYNSCLKIFQPVWKGTELAALQNTVNTFCLCLIL